VKGWEIDTNIPQPEYCKTSIEWFENKFNASLAEINEHYDKYRMSDALMTTYKLVWDDFCAWYLELIKPAYQSPIDAATYNATIKFFENIVRILHPFMPFVSEEIWHLLADRKEGDDLIINSWPAVQSVDQSIIGNFVIASTVVSEIRNFRQSKGISPKESLELIISKVGNTAALDQFGSSVIKLANLSAINFTDEKPTGAFPFVVQHYECYIPLSEAIDKDAEKDRLTKELEYTKGFLKSVAAKLSNERFVSNAKPDVVAAEQKKKADAESKIKSIEEALASL
jgi:valyl-tRNA synthetase